MTEIMQKGDGSYRVSRTQPPVAIWTGHLTNTDGRSREISVIYLAVQPGEVFGFLGPNGTGKTPAIGLLLRL